MKKYIYILLIILLITTPTVLKVFKKNHIVEYKIKDYTINETYNLTNKKHTYDIIMKNNREEYSYTLNKNYKKKKKIIKNIKEYKKGNIKCISPTYIIEGSKELYCIEDKIQVSNYYLKDNEDFKEILEKSKISINEEKELVYKYKKLTVYKNNFKDNKLVIWNYKGIYIINKDEVKEVKFLDYDLYDNIMSTTTSRYFVLFENNKVSGIENIHYYDSKKEEHNIFKLDKKLSKKSYINGVHKDIIYVTDLEKEMQYKVDIKKKNIEEVDEEENKFIKYINNTKTLVDKKEFLKKNQYFINERIVKKEISNKNDIININNYYYFKEDNKIYSRMLLSTKKLLLEKENIKEWNIFDNNILLAIDDGIYIYNDEVGLKRLIKYNEIDYNYKGIYYLWK